jgi:hypothetical protein
MGFGLIKTRRDFNAALERTEDSKDLIVVCCESKSTSPGLPVPAYRLH